MSYSTSIATMSNTSTNGICLDDFNANVSLTCGSSTIFTKNFMSGHTIKIIAYFGQMTTKKQLHCIFTFEVASFIKFSHRDVFKSTLKRFYLFSTIENKIAIQLWYFHRLVKANVINLNYDLSIIHISIRIVFHIKIQKLPHSHITMTMRENNLYGTMKIV